MKHSIVSVLALLVMFCGASPAMAQPINLSLVCNLGGVAAPMQMEVHHQSAYGVSSNARGHISGVFPTGINVYTAGVLQGSNVKYSFTGTNNFADFTEYPSGNRFRVKWILDPQNNGLWMVVNPFSGASRHFCTYRGAR